VIIIVDTYLLYEIPGQEVTDAIPACAGCVIMRRQLALKIGYTQFYRDWRTKMDTEEGSWSWVKLPPYPPPQSQVDMRETRSKPVSIKFLEK
jgi:hypothetical protein